MIKNTLLLFAFFISAAVSAQNEAPPQVDLRLYDIIDSVSAERIEADIRTLAGFGTRNTFSDTVSDTRGIGAARRWIKSEFEKISENCDGCLDVSYQKHFVEKDPENRIPKDAWIVNVVAIQKGTKYPN
ncbi:MAG TPA: peptidase M28, partial [Salinimicrobium sp.]|nr:peptidase M28 [Salinimicrobium sp.]